jgi:hypothetical protein
MHFERYRLLVGGLSFGINKSIRITFEKMAILNISRKEDVQQKGNLDKRSTCITDFWAIGIKSRFIGRLKCLNVNVWCLPNPSLNISQIMRVLACLLIRKENFSQ